MKGKGDAGRAPPPPEGVQAAASAGPDGLTGAQQTSKQATDHDDAAAAAAAVAAIAGTGYEDRVIGSLIGKMCGDVLGSAVEGDVAELITWRYPDGLTSFQPSARGYGRYTDDTQMAIALARSLLATGGRCGALHAARAYAAEYEPHRGYAGTAHMLLSYVKEHGVDEDTLLTMGTRYIPGGSFGNGGAMRIAPLALVYRHAPPEVLRAAVTDALLVTHTHPVSIDGAFVIAAAVAYLATRPPAPAATDGTAAAAAETAAAAAAVAGAGVMDAATAPAAAAAAAAAGSESTAWRDAATPLRLLDHVLSYGGLMATPGMVDKLRTLRQRYIEAPGFKAPGEPWSAFLASPRWDAERAVQALVSEPFQIRADDAAAAALGALAWHWEAPEEAVVAAAHYGGDTDTIAAIVGALAGALYGTGWLPGRWVGALENGPAGRDEAVALARRLAALDCRD